MAEDGDAVLHEGRVGRGAEFAALDLDGLAAGALDDAAAVAQGLLDGGLVGHEGHVHDDERAGRAAHDGGGVADHVHEADGQGVVVAQQGGAERIADEDQRNAGGVEEPGGLEIVGGEGGDFLGAFHGRDGARGQALGGVHGGLRYHSAWTGRISCPGGRAARMSRTRRSWPGSTR